ncbi:hypothetical protein B0H19DRAFT_1141990 [Mycena capillaripes]|nr:hypothetical protein B0H19DRAFT_1141990 [Mycena capillaripes]
MSLLFILHGRAGGRIVGALLLFFLALVRAPRAVIMTHPVLLLIFRLLSFFHVPQPSAGLFVLPRRLASLRPLLDSSGIGFALGTALCWPRSDFDDEHSNSRLV